jgi:hypothetical protein
MTSHEDVPAQAQATIPKTDRNYGRVPAQILDAFFVTDSYQPRPPVFGAERPMPSFPLSAVRSQAQGDRAALQSESLASHMLSGH